VTWLKTSPGGKRSNKNGDFSKFQTFPAPRWTAVRDDTMHHFTRLAFTSSGTMRVETYGVRGDGSPPILQDAFEYRDACPNRLQFEPSRLSFALEQGGSAPPQTARVQTGEGAAVAFEVTDDAAWLDTTPAGGSTPGDVSLSVDASSLEPGAHTATVTATSPGYSAARLAVTLNMTGTRRLVVSSSSSRTAPTALEGATLVGNRYVFLTPAEGIDDVRFHLDDPDRSGTPFTIERNPPWDFAGTASNGRARPFDTGNLSNGAHSITAAYDVVGGGREVVHADFSVAN
jgi:hypothetical protein